MREGILWVVLGAQIRTSTIYCAEAVSYEMVKRIMDPTRQSSLLILWYCVQVQSYIACVVARGVETRQGDRGSSSVGKIGTD